MTLLIDIGNSRTKYILADLIDSNNSRVIDNDCIDVNWLDDNLRLADKILISCVSSNAILTLIINWANINVIEVKVIESEASRYGLVSFYQQPKKLGVDRWLAMIGALSLYSGKNILIVDAGTATTIDLVSASGQHHGGWILPGINLMIDSLLANTSKIEANKDVKPSLSFGDNTNTNVNNGCWGATIGAINLAMTQASKELGSIDEILLTGGNARYIKALLDDKSIIEDNLILHGLQRYKLD
jgi:type III pantothenate kinase